MKKPIEIQNFQNVKFFLPLEFDSPDAPGTGDLMNIQLVYKLDMIRTIINTPIFIKSGYRTKKHNKEIGGEKNSAHLKGLAVDIFCDDSITRFLIVRYALYLRISRIGIYQAHIHLDIDDTKPQKILFLGTYQDEKITTLNQATPS